MPGQKQGEDWNFLTALVGRPAVTRCRERDRGRCFLPDLGPLLITEKQQVGQAVSGGEWTLLQAAPGQMATEPFLGWGWLISLA